VGFFLVFFWVGFFGWVFRLPTLFLSDAYPNLICLFVETPVDVPGQVGERQEARGGVGAHPSQPDEQAEAQHPAKVRRAKYTPVLRFQIMLLRIPSPAFNFRFRLESDPDPFHDPAGRNETDPNRSGSDPDPKH